jgi:hypothetical protein
MIKQHPRLVPNVWDKQGDTFLFWAGALRANRRRLHTRLPPQHNTTTPRRCHPSHNPYDPPFGAHGGGHAPSHTLSPGQHPTAHHTTMNRPVFSTERRFVPISLCSGRPAPLTTGLRRMFSAPGPGPETPERRVGGDLVCGHVRNYRGGHSCRVL